MEGQEDEEQNAQSFLKINTESVFKIFEWGRGVTF